MATFIYVGGLPYSTTEEDVRGAGYQRSEMDFVWTNRPR